MEPFLNDLGLYEQRNVDNSTKRKTILRRDVIFVDSSLRDKDAWSRSSEYEFPLEKSLSNVKSIKLTSTQFYNTSLLINDYSYNQNNQFFAQVNDYPYKEINLDIGNYSTLGLETEIKNKFEKAFPTHSFDVSIDQISELFLIRGWKYYPIDTNFYSYDLESSHDTAHQKSVFKTDIPIVGTTFTFFKFKEASNSLNNSFSDIGYHPIIDLNGYIGFQFDTFKYKFGLNEIQHIFSEHQIEGSVTMINTINFYNNDDFYTAVYKNSETVDATAIKNTGLISSFGDMYHLSFDQQKIFISSDYNTFANLLYLFEYNLQTDEYVKREETIYWKLANFGTTIYAKNYVGGEYPFENKVKLLIGTTSDTPEFTISSNRDGSLLICNMYNDANYSFSLGEPIESLIPSIPANKFMVLKQETGSTMYLLKGARGITTANDSALQCNWCDVSDTNTFIAGFIGESPTKVYVEYFINYGTTEISAYDYASVGAEDIHKQVLYETKEYSGSDSDKYGYSTAIDGQGYNAVVGAPYKDTNGKVFTYKIQVAYVNELYDGTAYGVSYGYVYGISADGTSFLMVPEETYNGVTLPGITWNYYDSNAGITFHAFIGATFNSASYGTTYVIGTTRQGITYGITFMSGITITPSYAYTNKFRKLKLIDEVELSPTGLSSLYDNPMWGKCVALDKETGSKLVVLGSDWIIWTYYRTGNTWNFGSTVGITTIYPLVEYPGGTTTTASLYSASMSYDGSYLIVDSKDVCIAEHQGKYGGYWMFKALGTTSWEQIGDLHYTSGNCNAYSAGSKFNTNSVFVLGGTSNHSIGSVWVYNLLSNKVIQNTKQGGLYIPDYDFKIDFSESTTPRSILGFSAEEKSAGTTYGYAITNAVGTSYTAIQNIRLGVKLSNSEYIIFFSEAHSYSENDLIVLQDHYTNYSKYNDILNNTIGYNVKLVSDSSGITNFRTLNYAGQVYYYYKEMVNYNPFWTGGIGERVLYVHISNHGLSTGDNIFISGITNIDESANHLGFNQMDVNGVHGITVYDKDNVYFTVGTTETTNVAYSYNSELSTFCSVPVRIKFLIDTSYFDNAIIISQYTQPERQLWTSSTRENDISYTTVGISGTVSKIEYYNTATDLNLTTQNYIYMTIEDNQSLKSSNQMMIADKSFNVLGKILFSNNKNELLVNKFVSNPLIFDNIQHRIETIKFKFIDKFGEQVDFNEKNHSFTLDFISVDDSIEATTFNSRRGFKDRTEYLFELDT